MSYQIKTAPRDLLVPGLIFIQALLSEPFTFWNTKPAVYVFHFVNFAPDSRFGTRKRLFMCSFS